jgi:hypothetical protein
MSVYRNYKYIIINFMLLHVSIETNLGAVVEALRYKPEGRWLLFVTKMNNLYCAVRTGSLNEAFNVSSLGQ